MNTEAPALLVQLLATEWQLSGDWQPLAGYADQNWRLATSSGDYVVKVASPNSGFAELDLQVQAQRFLTENPQRFLTKLNFTNNPQRACAQSPQQQNQPALQVPALLPTRHGELLHFSPALQRFVRVQQYLAGTPCACVAASERDEKLLFALGEQVGALSRQLSEFCHPYASRSLDWDLAQAPLRCEALLPLLQSQVSAPIWQQLQQTLAEAQLRLLPQLSTLPRAVIHNDANDHNLLLQQDAAGHWQSAALLDFGDMVHSIRVAELAVLAAYLLPDSADPQAALLALTRGFCQQVPLSAAELGLLPLLVRLRYLLSLCNSAEAYRQTPDNDYLLISRAQVLAGLDWFASQNPVRLELALLRAAGLSVDPGADKHNLLARRRTHLSPSLSLSYREPLKIIRGHGAYLFDEQGRDYLDMVNNVCHVGHCHPRVVAAASAQMSRLNTNTRYLHDNLLSYSEALLSKMPAPLSVCFLVNSGSEANELALRIARTVTGRRDVLVVEGAYHGNSNACIDISPYKFLGKGGAGQPAHVHIAPLPYPFRGRYRGHDSAPLYLNDALQVVAQAPQPPGAFITEAVQGVPGQIVMPPGYLAGLYPALRAQGTLCIADEVQIGFGRLGDEFWGFATQQVVPDIVTLGKPIGNGHPMGAVVTTRAIADAFANGMEYFNTFGGNPVSCAVGLAVLDVIAEEQLQQKAASTGAYLCQQLQQLSRAFPIIADVRGYGLFLGVELMDPANPDLPATAVTSWLIEYLKSQRILLSSEGPDANILKIKPPLVFGQAEADRFLTALAQGLRLLPADLSA